jgi:hypothetical protein
MHYWYQRQKWPIQRNVLAKRFAPPTPESIEDSHCCPQTSPEDVWTKETLENPSHPRENARVSAGAD